MSTWELQHLMKVGDAGCCWSMTFSVCCLDLLHARVRGPLRRTLVTGDCSGIQFVGNQEKNPQQTSDGEGGADPEVVSPTKPRSNVTTSDASHDRAYADKDSVNSLHDTK